MYRGESDVAFAGGGVEFVSVAAEGAGEVVAVGPESSLEALAVAAQSDVDVAAAGDLGVDEKDAAAGLVGADADGVDDLAGEVADAIDVAGLLARARSPGYKLVAGGAGGTFGSGGAGGVAGVRLPGGGRSVPRLAPGGRVGLFGGALLAESVVGPPVAATAVSGGASVVSITGLLLPAALAVGACLGRPVRRPAPGGFGLLAAVSALTGVLAVFGPAFLAGGPSTAGVALAVVAAAALAAEDVGEVRLLAVARALLLAIAFLFLSSGRRTFGRVSRTTSLVDLRHRCPRPGSYGGPWKLSSVDREGTSGGRRGSTVFRRPRWNRGAFTYG